MTRFADRIATLGTENAFSVGADIAKIAARGTDVVKLNIGEPDFDSAAHINEAAIAEIRRGNSHYCDPQGTIGLREAICGHLLKTRGLHVTPDRVVVTTAASLASASRFSHT